MTETTPTAARRHRFEVRITAEQEALIREAADLANETVTTFILSTATDRARRLIDTQRTTTLPSEVFDRFYAALDEPPRAIPELAALLAVESFPRG